MPPYPALNIAKWFISYASATDADISNLKLQKLLYYAQGHYLAKTNQPLFEDRIEAWTHGPVVPDIYHCFKSFRSADIELSDDDQFAFGDIDPDTTQFLLQIWETYARYSAWGLRNMTHSEQPWKSVFNGPEINPEISLESVRSYFSSFQTDVLTSLQGVKS